MRTRHAFLLLSVVGCVASTNEDEAIGTSAAALTSGPDLQVTNLVAPVSVGPFADFTVTATVCNKGNVDAGENTINVVLARTPDDFANATFLGKELVPALSAGACSAVAVHAQSGSASFGYLGATADALNEIAERNEGNNFRAGKRIAFGPLADLVVTSVTAPPNIGASAPISARICNRGTATAMDSRVDFFASVDPTISSPQDAWVGQASVPMLDPGACADAAIAGAFPPPPPGVSNVYVGAMADAADTTIELNEGNNTRATGPLGWGDGPDFIVTSFATPPSSDYNQHFFATTVTLCNQGTAPGYAPDVVIALSDDATIDLNDPHDAIVGRGYPQGTLASGQCTTLGVNVDGMIPELERGYYVAAVLDPNHTIAELQETNNVSAANQVAIGHGPDLVVSTITANATIKICNQGTRASDLTRVSLTNESGFLASVDVLPLDAGQCRSLAAASLLYPGSYTLTASIVPPTGELITTNNAKSRAIVVN